MSFKVLFRPQRATNCIHALSDLGLTTSLLHTLGSRRRAASTKVLNYLGPWIRNPSRVYEEARSLFRALIRTRIESSTSITGPMPNSIMSIRASRRR